MSRCSRRAGRVLIRLLVVGLALTGGGSCSLLQGDDCADGCTDAQGNCLRAVSDTHCGYKGARCMDCRSDDQTCDLFRGVCRPRTDPEPDAGTADPHSCRVDSRVVALGKQCSPTAICQLTRGGMGTCREIPPEPCADCVDGCCTYAGRCLRASHMVGCSREYCNEYSYDSGICGPPERCSDDCDGCCTPEGKCRGGGSNTACGTGGIGCSDCTAIDRVCNEQQTCGHNVDPGVESDIRVCLEQAVFDGDIESCGFERASGKVSVSATITSGIRGGYGHSYETTAAGRGFIGQSSTNVAFDAGCIYVAGDEDFVLMEFEERDGDSGDDPCFDPTSRLWVPCNTLTGSDTTGCDPREDIGSCEVSARMLTDVALRANYGREDVTVNSCSGSASSVSLRVSLSR